MPKPLRVCTESGCPSLTSRSSGRCDEHERARRKAQDALRPSTAERGYGSDHQTDRAAIKRRILSGEVFACARCGQPILPGQAWDLDHTDDRTGYLGPSHRHARDCPAGGNRATKRNRCEYVVRGLGRCVLDAGHEGSHSIWFSLTQPATEQRVG